MDKKPPSPLGARLLDAIERKYGERRQQRLVEALQVRPNLVSGWIHGTLPNTQHLMAISVELDVSIDFLLFEEESGADLDQRPINRLPPTLRHTITLMEGASVEARELLERAAGLLRTGHPDIMGAMRQVTATSPRRIELANKFGHDPPEESLRDPTG